MKSKRFDLKSFKALGGAFAVDKIANAERKILLLQQQLQEIMEGQWHGGLKG